MKHCPLSPCTPPQAGSSEAFRRASQCAVSMAQLQVTAEASTTQHRLPDQNIWVGNTLLIHWLKHMTSGYCVLHDVGTLYHHSDP